MKQLTCGTFDSEDMLFQNNDSPPRVHAVLRMTHLEVDHILVEYTNLLYVLTQG